MTTLTLGFLIGLVVGAGLPAAVVWFVDRAEARMARAGRAGS